MSAGAAISAIIAAMWRPSKGDDVVCGFDDFFFQRRAKLESLDVIIR